MARSEAIILDVRQQPQQALVAPENKEKTRKPIDPPPIVQLRVDRRHDGSGTYLVNPFLFMMATLVDAEQENESTRIPGISLIGQSVSSLHRLKDIDNTGQLLERNANEAIP